MKEKVTAKRKPKKCPKCGCAKIASIQYGMPAFSPELRMDLDEGKIVLGGCCVSNDDPAWQCVECGMQIYREEKISHEAQKDYPMESTRKKALEIMQKGLVSYQLLSKAWDVSDHFGDGCDLIAEKAGRFIKIELKAIDLNSIKSGKNATQHLSANEIVTATHLIITVFNGIETIETYIMTIRQFVENSGVKKFEEYESFEDFIDEYKDLARANSRQVKNSPNKKTRLDFDLSFNPRNAEKWKLAKFKNRWGNIEL